MTTATSAKPSLSNFDPKAKLDYGKYLTTLKVIKDRLQRPLTLSEKILYGHLADPHNQEIIRGKSYLRLNPDRIAMQDATAQVQNGFG